ncbi:phosphatase PAP2 family protein [Inquilinus sp. KBS0705]|nr:phosphatase PAP2 family protein [Inquilinus sp. KBS0705]
MKKVVVIILCLLAFKANAQQVTTDTTKKVSVIDTLKKDLLTVPDTVKHLHTKAWAMVPPAVLVAYGASNFFIPAVRRLDVSIYNDVNEDHPNFKHHPENYFQYTPAALVYGLNLVGVHGKNTFVDRTFIYLMAEGMMGATTFILKKATHRLRPDGSNYYSFPSGHTANAFAGAEFMAQELGGKSIGYSAVGYGFATATGVLRIYNRDHWFSDVIAGAGFGILATKGAYLLYPYIRNTFFKGDRDKEKNKDVPVELKKQRSSSSLLLPSYNNGVLGMQFAMEF